MVFNNLLWKKKIVSEVGGSNCQQPVSENTQMEKGKRGADAARALQCLCNYRFQIISV